MTKFIIAIHNQAGEFSTQWIEYCRSKNLPYKVVNCYAADIIKQLRSCSALMWHWPQTDLRAMLFARQLIAAVEGIGLTVFPSSATAWHYDDKIGQKYLLEAIGAPLVPTYIFYEKAEALEWAADASFPKVWKLRGGAGSANVRLVKSYRHAKAIISRSFGKGWSGYPRLYSLRERVWQYRRDRTARALVNVGRGLARALVSREYERNAARERGYVYFQDLIPACAFDIRVIVIGSRAFGIKRHVRKGDFRASGSGIIGYERADVPLECVRLAFQLTRQLGAQCLAYDFVIEGDQISLLEVSYSFSRRGYLPCRGYWDSALTWHEGAFTPEWFMVEEVYQEVARSHSRGSA